jgi:hypothetical protein
MNLKLKVLIILVCSLIITMVPASAVHTGDILANMDDIKDNQNNIKEDNKKITKTSYDIESHTKIIQDTINQMNDVKWYQFWKWDFYLRQGPNKLKSEGKIIELLSQSAGSTESNAEQDENRIANTGEKGIELALKASNQENNSNVITNAYNTGDARENAQLIARELSSHFNNKYTATAPINLVKGDIVQITLSHNNYVYLQYIGMDPTKDTALFIGNKNTAVRLPVDDMRVYINLKLKKQPSTNLTL